MQSRIMQCSYLISSCHFPVGRGRSEPSGVRKATSAYGSANKTDLLPRPSNGWLVDWSQRIATSAPLRCGSERGCPSRRGRGCRFCPFCPFVCLEPSSQLLEMRLTRRKVCAARQETAKHALFNQEKPRQATSRPSQAKSSQTKYKTRHQDRLKQGQAKPSVSQAKPGQAKPRQVKTGQAKTR